MYFSSFVTLFFSICSVKLHVVAGDANTIVSVTPPELLIDVPFSMGCYKIREDVSSNADPITKEFDLPDPSPASCILECFKKDPEYRVAGKRFYQRRETFLRFLIKRHFHYH